MIKEQSKPSELHKFAKSAVLEFAMMGNLPKKSDNIDRIKKKQTKPPRAWIVKKFRIWEAIQVNSLFSLNSNNFKTQRSPSPNTKTSSSLQIEDGS